MAIVAQESAPKEGQLTRQEQRNNSEIKALQEIQKEVNSLTRTVRKLNFSQGLASTKATVNDETIATVTSASQAIAGEYNFEVDKLALTQRDRLLQVKEGSTFTSGIIEFTGNSVNKTIKIDLKVLSDTKGEALTIDEVQAAINKEASSQGAQVKATLVRSQGEINLVLNAVKSGTVGTGSSAQQPFVVNRTLAVSPANGVTAGHSSLQSAQNAQVKFGSMELSSSSNKMENVIDGISLDLNKVGAINVKVESDNESNKKKISEFVDDYNELLKAVSKHSSAKDGKKAALSGNGAVRGMLSQIRGALIATYDASSFGNLTQLGITTNRDGQLEIDDKKLDKALTDTPNEVMALLSGKDSKEGLMDKLTDALSHYKSSGGLYNTRINSLEEANKRTAKQLEALDRQMQARASSLRSYYAAMDSRIASMKQTQMSMAATLG